jgi:hypothetical protein
MHQTIMLLVDTSNLGDFDEAIDKAVDFLDDLTDSGKIDYYDENDLREEPLADNLELVNDNAIDHIARANEELNILNELREKGETENIVLAWRARNYATLISDGFRAGITSVFDITDVTIGTHNIQDAIENPENYTVVFARIHY